MWDKHENEYDNSTWFVVRQQQCKTTVMYLKIIVTEIKQQTDKQAKK